MLSLRSELLTRHGFRHGFSLRSGGVSLPPFDTLNLARGIGDDPVHVRENHLRLARDVGYDAQHLYEVSQVHGARVELIDPSVASDVFRVREADALVCATPTSDVQIGLGVRVADCVALLLAHPASGAVAAIHAGWRGTVAGVVGATVEVLCAQANARPFELVVAVFPYIGPAAFEVGDEVAERIAACAPRDPRVIDKSHAKPHADLGRAIAAQLAEAGVANEHIERVPGCTFSEPARFFSYRRDGAASGRHLAAIIPRC